MSISVGYPIRACGAEDLSQWVRRIALGDPDALAGLYEQTRCLVYRWVVRILRHADDANEVVLDVYAQVWRHSTRFDPSRGSVEAWLCTIARTRALDRLRSRNARADLDETSRHAAADIADQRSLDAPCTSFEAHRLARLALNSLSHSDRRLIALSFYEGYSHREIAEIVDLPLGTVKTRIRQSLRVMRRTLDSRTALMPAVAA
jgi:RNA polymerase sigma-70 factor, ECF subfamily